MIFCFVNWIEARLECPSVSPDSRDLHHFCENGSLAPPYGHSYTLVRLTSRCWFCCELMVQVPASLGPIQRFLFSEREDGVQAGGFLLADSLCIIDYLWVINLFYPFLDFISILGRLWQMPILIMKIIVGKTIDLKNEFQKTLFRGRLTDYNLQFRKIPITLVLDTSHSTFRRTSSPKLRRMVGKGSVIAKATSKKASEAASRPVSFIYI